MTVRQAILQILEQAQSPLKTSEILSLILKMNLYEFDTDHPETIVNKALSPSFALLSWGAYGTEGSLQKALQCRRWGCFLKFGAAGGARGFPVPGVTCLGELLRHSGEEVVGKDADEDVAFDPGFNLIKIWPQSE